MFALTDFEKRGALSMLDYMAKPEAALWMVTPLFRQMNVSQKAFYARLKFLKESKLIEEINPPGVGEQHFLRLTPRGWAAATKLKEFLGIVNQEVFQGGPIP